MLENIYSGSDYAKLLIEGVIESENSFPENERMDPTLLKYWIEEIQSATTKNYNDYLIGERDDFMFDKEEFKATFERAAHRQVDDTITGLLEKDMLSMSIGEDGEILYSLSEIGRNEANKMFGKAGLN